jgi:thiosulfate/3-mercaptopyruvate sulfurtransferase
MYHLGKYCAALAFTAVFMFSGCSPGSEPAAPGVLVSTQWLQDHLNDPDLVILHSGTSEVYDSVHIPGARLINPYDFTVNTSTNRNEMPPADSIVKLLRMIGVNSDSQIVLYSENIGLLNRTARVFVALDHLGLGERTKVLSGGLSAWLEEGQERSDVLAEPAPGNLEVLNLKELVITATEVDRQRWSSNVVLIDARSDEEYYGSPAADGSLAEGGHIEGAYLLSYLNITLDDSPYLFRSDKELRELFQRAGTDSGKKTIFYCNSGIKGSLNYLSARHLGYPVLLYDGSFEEWEDLGLPSIRPVALPHDDEQNTTYD